MVTHGVGRIIIKELAGLEAAIYLGTTANEREEAIAVVDGIKIDWEQRIIHSFF